jgi:hypothetical protein
MDHTVLENFELRHRFEKLAFNLRNRDNFHEYFWATSAVSSGSPDGLISASGHSDDLDLMELDDLFVDSLESDTPNPTQVFP